MLFGLPAKSKLPIQILPTGIILLSFYPIRRQTPCKCDAKKQKLSKAFENLSPKPQPKPQPNTGTIQAIKDALFKKGVNLDDMDELFNQLEKA